MIKRVLLTLTILALCLLQSDVMAQFPTRRAKVQEADGDPSGYYSTINVTNGSLTEIDDQTATLNFTTTSTVSFNDTEIVDDTPHLGFKDSDDNTGYMWHLDTSTANAPWQNYGLWRGTYSGLDFSVNPNKPLLYFDNDNNLHNLGSLSIGTTWNVGSEQYDAIEFGQNDIQFTFPDGADGSSIGIMAGEGATAGLYLWADAGADGGGNWSPRLQLETQLDIDKVAITSDKDIVLRPTLGATHSILFQAEGDIPEITTYDNSGTSNLKLNATSGTIVTDSAIIIGVNDTGKDFKAFGDTSGKYVEWDASADTFTVAGTAYFTGNLIDGTSTVTIAELDAHLSDTSDPHGATMSVSTMVQTPEIEWPISVTIDAINDGPSTVSILNSSAIAGDIANLSVEGAVTAGGTGTFTNLIISSGNATFVGNIMPVGHDGSNLGSSDIYFADAYILYPYVDTLYFNTETLTYDAITDNDFEISDDLNIEDGTPHVRLTDTTSGEDDFEMWADGNQVYLSNVTDSKEYFNINHNNLIEFYNKYAFPDSTPTDNQILKYDAALGRFAFEADATGAGETDHATLTNLEWNATGHTFTAANSTVNFGSYDVTTDGNIDATIVTAGGTISIGNNGFVGTITDTTGEISLIDDNISSLGLATFGSLSVNSNTVNFADTTDEYVLAFDTTTQTWRGAAGGAATDHSTLSNLEWNVAAHTFAASNSTVDFGTYDLNMGNTLTMNSKTETIKFDTSTQDFEFSDDANFSDANVHLGLIDTTPGEDDFELVADGNQFYLTNTTDSKEYFNINQNNLVEFYNKYAFPDGVPSNKQILKYDAALNRLTWGADDITSGTIGYTDNDDNEGNNIGGATKWGGQTFTTEGSFVLDKIQIKAKRALPPGTITVSIRAVDVDGHPTGADLSTGTSNGDTLTTDDPGEWREIDMTAYTLAASTKYAIVIRCLDGTEGFAQIWWRGDWTSPTYSGGCLEASADAGSTWTSFPQYEQMFLVIGTDSHSTLSNLEWNVSGHTFTASNSTVNFGSYDLQTSGKLYFGSETIYYDSVTNSDFDFSDDIRITDATPALYLIDSDGDDFHIYAENNIFTLSSVTDNVDILYVLNDHSLEVRQDAVFDKDLTVAEDLVVNGKQLGRQPHILQGSLGTGDFDTDPDVWLMDLHSDVYPAGIVITSITVDCNEADPTTELNADLKYCDAVAGGAFPGANATTIATLDTTTGNAALSPNYTVPTGKSLYITIDADPTSDTTIFHVRVHFNVPVS